MRLRRGSSAAGIVDHAIAGARLLPLEPRRKVQAAIAAALLALQRGQAPEFHWRACADALAVAEALAELGICSDAASRQKIADAEIALGVVWKRWDECGAWTLHADELRLLDEGLWLHRVQLDLCSMREYETAIARTVRKMRQALAGNGGPGVTVLGR
jgi:hypothetical protein